MDWSTITNKSSAQYKLREEYKKTGNDLFDGNGLADIYSRKVIACTSKFGGIGDEIEVTFKNKVYYWNQISGTLFAIICDIKDPNDSNYCEWGHLYTNGKQCSVVEFIVDSKRISNIKETFTLLKNNQVVKIERTGVNFFDKIREDLNY